MDAQLEPTGTHALWDETFQKLGRSAPPQRADEASTTISGGWPRWAASISHAVSKSLALILLDCRMKWFPSSQR